MNNKENLPIKLDYTNPATIKTLKETVAKGATDSEFAMFAGMCQATGLNPFKREIWFIKTGSGVQMMTGINGFYEIANKHPAYDGCETEVVEEAGKIIKAICRVYRKDRSHPTTAEAYFAEYGKPYGNWKTMPRLMLSKCAESMAHRKAFPQELNGLYTAEEMPGEYSQQNGGNDQDAINKAVVAASMAEGAKLLSKVDPKPAPQRANGHSATEKAVLEVFPASTVEEKDLPLFYFVLDKVQPEKVAAASNLLEKLGAKYDAAHDGYIAGKNSPRLKNCQIAKEAFLARGAGQGADREIDLKHDQFYNQPDPVHGYGDTDPEFLDSQRIKNSNQI